MQRAEKMNILTAVLVLLSLISVSRCQSQDQIECITSKINERAQDIAIACEHVANFSIQGICDDANCRAAYSEIYNECEIDFSLACSADFGGDSGLAAEQIQCLETQSRVRAIEVWETCGSDFSDSDSIITAFCEPGPCQDLMLDISRQCNYTTFIADSCNFQHTSDPTPAGDGNGGGGDYTPVDDCLERETLDNLEELVDNCPLSELSSNDFSTACETPSCLDIITRIYTTCNYEEAINFLCSGNGGGGEVTQPTAEELTCFSNTIADRVSDFISECGTDVNPQDFSDVASLCGAGKCVKFISSIYISCGYDEFNAICSGGDGDGGDDSSNGQNVGGDFNNIFNSGVIKMKMNGSIRMYAIPGFLLVALLFSFMMN